MDEIQKLRLKLEDLAPAGHLLRSMLLLVNEELNQLNGLVT